MVSSLSVGALFWDVLIAAVVATLVAEIITYFITHNKRVSGEAFTAVFCYNCNFKIDVNIDYI